ncbi:PIN domain-containing protein [Victivallis lenta]|mgnify:CR=1 FL=1|jgi:hypothetical protein|uniref:PIN domain-containing protein n=1 Tax=Victivallis lenta TaxID=2606640 RepID=UPI00235639D8|nr:PIN domain-containing protein [Victivallis lenta]
MIVSEFIQILHKNPAPVLFCDTCALLDVIRLPHRAKSGAVAEHTISAVLSIYDKICEASIYFVISELIPKEFGNNCPAEAATLQNHMARLKQHIEIYEKISKKLLPTDLISSSFTFYDIESELKVICDKILEKAIILDINDEIRYATFNRVSECLYPAARGKESFNDCCIYETLLSMSREIKNCGITVSVGFITSNVNDFGATSAPKTNIQNDFRNLNINFFNTWNHANTLS